MPKPLVSLNPQSSLESPHPKKVGFAPVEEEKDFSAAEFIEKEAQPEVNIVIENTPQQEKPDPKSKGKSLSEDPWYQNFYFRLALGAIVASTTAFTAFISKLGGKVDSLNTWDDVNKLWLTADADKRAWALNSFFSSELVNTGTNVAFLIKYFRTTLIVFYFLGQRIDKLTKPLQDKISSAYQTCREKNCCCEKCRSKTSTQDYQSLDKKEDKEERKEEAWYTPKDPFEKMIQANTGISTVFILWALLNGMGFGKISEDSFKFLETFSPGLSSLPFIFTVMQYFTTRLHGLFVLFELWKNIVSSCRKSNDPNEIEGTPTSQKVFIEKLSTHLDSYTEKACCGICLCYGCCCGKPSSASAASSSEQNEELLTNPFPLDVKVDPVEEEKDNPLSAEEKALKAEDNVRIAMAKFINQFHGHLKNKDAMYERKTQSLTDSDSHEFKTESEIVKSKFVQVSKAIAWVIGIPTMLWLASTILFVIDPKVVGSLESLFKTDIGKESGYKNPLSKFIGMGAGFATSLFYGRSGLNAPERILTNLFMPIQICQAARVNLNFKGAAKNLAWWLVTSTICHWASYFSGEGLKGVASAEVDNGYLSYLTNGASKMADYMIDSSFAAAWITNLSPCLDLLNKNIEEKNTALIDYTKIGTIDLYTAQMILKKPGFRFKRGDFALVKETWSGLEKMAPLPRSRTYNDFRGNDPSPPGSNEGPEIRTPMPKRPSQTGNPAAAALAAGAELPPPPKTSFAPAV